MYKGFYKHENCIDAYVNVIEVQFKGSDYWKVKVEWWVRDYPITKPEVIRIKVTDLDKWKPHRYVRKEGA